MSRRIRKMLSLLAFVLTFVCLHEVCAEPQQSANGGDNTQAFEAPLILKSGGDEELELVRNLFQYGDYPAVVTHLEEAMRQGLFDSEEQQLEAYRHLGVTYYILQQKERSKESFMLLLTREPDYQLDPLYVPPIIIDFFESIKEENRQLLDEIRQARIKTAEKEQPPLKKEYFSRNAYAVNFIPFGVGQFQNGQPVKGTLFAAAETISLALNITSYFMVRGYRGDDGMYTSGNAKLARDWRITQFVSLGVFAILAVGGVIDAALNYREYTPLPESEAPQDDSDENSDKPKVGFLYVEF